jgi:hypothetical protein
MTIINAQETPIAKEEMFLDNSLKCLACNAGPWKNKDKARW